MGNVNLGGRASAWSCSSPLHRQAFYREWMLPAADGEVRQGDYVTLSSSAVADLETVEPFRYSRSMVSPGSYCDYICEGI